MKQANQVTAPSKGFDAEDLKYFEDSNAILNRMKKAILNNKGIRLSAEEMQFIATMQIGQIILDEDANPNRGIVF